MRKSKYYLILILLVATFLRLWKLSEVPVSMFGDELDVGYHAFNILKTGRDYSGNFMPLHFQSLAEWRTPLYLYSSVPTVAIFGISPLGVRLPAALFGILGVFGIYLLVKEMLICGKRGKDLDSKYLVKTELTSLTSALLMALSPWHIQYSRAAFEVTQLLVFYIFGIYFFFRSLRNGKWLWVSGSLLVLTPMVYSSAKLFTPILLVLLFTIWFREILRMEKKHIFYALVGMLILGLPTVYTTFWGGGAQRFGYISVFTDPTREMEVGVKRELAAHVRGETGVGLEPTLMDKVFYNKFTFWGDKIIDNYFQPFSSEFLFIKGDLNLRHSIEGVGQFYMVEAIALMLGLVLFFGKYNNKKIKIFIALWIILGVLPSAITRDGGRHATRLILILPPLAFLISYGLSDIYYRLKKPYKAIFVLSYILLFVINFINYQNLYWRENPWYSERWWHSGYKEAILSVKELEDQYDEVLITMSNEPAWIFFGAYMEYDPNRWQEVKPDSNWVDDNRYGRITTIDKYYFVSPKGQLYDWGRDLEEGVLVLSSEKDVGIDLVKEPERTPGDLTLIKSITYPSGLPAFYLFEKKSI